MDPKSLCANILATLTSHQKVMEHPDFPAAYEDTLQNAELPFRQKDVSDTVTFVYVLTSIGEFDVDEKNRLLFFSRIPTDPYVWVNGKWVDSSELED